jgi:hypothetical protein
MDKKLNVLTEKVDRLLHFQEDVTEKLQCVCQGMDHLEQDLHRLEASRELSLAGSGSTPPTTAQAAWPEVLELVRAVRQEGAQHGARLEALFKMVVAVDRAITLVGSTFQNSKVADFIMQGTVPGRKGSLADGPEEVGSGFPDLAGVVSGDPDGELGQEMVLRRAGDSVSLCILCLVVEEMKGGNLKTIDGFPHSPVIPTLFKNKKNEVVIQSEWILGQLQATDRDMRDKLAVRVLRSELRERKERRKREWGAVLI